MTDLEKADCLTGKAMGGIVLKAPTPFLPISDPVQGRLQGPPAKSKFLAAKFLAAILATAFLMVSCGNNAPLPHRWNIYDFPSVSEFDRRKTKAPTIEQAKKSIQLLADETAKDPESLKMRKVRVGDFYWIIDALSDTQYFGHLVEADTDSKNSYGGYEGYKPNSFSIITPGAKAIPFTIGRNLVNSRKVLGGYERIKELRNELSDDEFVKFLAKGGIVPEKRGRQDTYINKKPYYTILYWIPKKP